MEDAIKHVSNLTFIKHRVDQSRLGNVASSDAAEEQAAIKDPTGGTFVASYKVKVWCGGMPDSEQQYISFISQITSHGVRSVLVLKIPNGLLQGPRLLAYLSAIQTP